MAETFLHSWQSLPDLILGDIMTMAGLESLENFQKTREVCQSWDRMMLLEGQRKRQTIRNKAVSQAEWIRNRWGSRSHTPLIPEIITAATLAHHGFMDSVQENSLGRYVANMKLQNVDLSRFPVAHLASLASCVEGTLVLENLTNCPLIRILDRFQGRTLEISEMSLNEEETLAVKQRLESNVWMLQLGFNGEVTLSFDNLMEYNGRGVCEVMYFYNETAKNNLTKIKAWGENIGWQPSESSNGNQIEFLQRFL